MNQKRAKMLRRLSAKPEHYKALKREWKKLSSTEKSKLSVKKGV